MSFFRLPRRDPERFAEEGPRQKLVRHLLILLLLGCVGTGFWLNSRRFGALPAKHAPRIVDSTGVLGAEDKERLGEYAEKFFAAYGIFITIRIQNEAFPGEVLPERERARTLFLGLSPGSGQVRLEVPPLAAALLGEECIAYLRREHFSPCFALGDWRKGLAAALNLLAEKLDQALAAGKGRQTEKPGVSP